MNGVVVVGGGVAGCAAALALLRQDIGPVTLIEGGPPARVGESLPPEAREALSALGLWEAFVQEGHAPCLGTSSVWGSEALGYNDHLVHPAGQGWHLDRPRFDAFLRRAAVQAGARLRPGFVQAVERRGAGFALSVEGETVPARALIDASGRRATVGRALGAQPLQHDRLAYVSQTLRVDRLPQLTLLEAVEAGWWYLAGLPGGRATVALATDLESAAPLRAPEAFAAALARSQIVSTRVAGASILDRPATTVAVSGLTGPPAGPGWLAVGDAAFTVDPIMAQGIHKALRDGPVAAAQIAAGLAGDEGAAGRYATWAITAFRGYLAARQALYAGEGRWADAPFWRRRRARRGLVAPEAPLPDGAEIGPPGPRASLEGGSTRAPWALRSPG